MSHFPQALTIAGSDSGGGAGIQTDLKTFQMRGVFGTSVLTAVTAQNTLGVHHIHRLPLENISAQLTAACDDFSIDAVKIGMLGDAEIIQLVAQKLQQYALKNIVLDPVMIAKGGAKLLQDSAIWQLKENLIPLCTLITPNLPECEVLTGISVYDDHSALKAAQYLQALGAKNVMIKGGHTADFAGETSNDWILIGNTFFTLPAKRFHTPHTHGTGCTLSSCITAELAKGESVKNAIIHAKKFITDAISHPLNIGHGHGPVNLWAGNEALNGEVNDE